MSSLTLFSDPTGVSLEWRKTPHDAPYVVRDADGTDRFYMSEQRARAAAHRLIRIIKAGQEAEGANWRANLRRYQAAILAARESRESGDYTLAAAQMSMVRTALLSIRYWG
jgi:hypothetical protein